MKKERKQKSTEQRKVAGQLSSDVGGAAGGVRAVEQGRMGASLQTDRKARRYNMLAALI